MRVDFALTGANRSVKVLNMDTQLALPTLSQASLIARFVHRIRAWCAIDAMCEKINPVYLTEVPRKHRQNIIDYAVDEARASWSGIRA